ncbi:MAG: hypothetical protein RL038_612 [Actinomycetota bacterium]
MNEAVLTAVCKAVAEVFELPVESLSADTELAVVAADSVGLIVVADIVESAGWNLSDEALKNARTIGDLAASVE